MATCGPTERAAIVTWGYDYRGGVYNELYVQRIGPTGAPLWTVNGVPLVMGSDTFGPTIVSDSNGGAVVSWTRVMAGDIRAQRVDASGTPQWGPGGTAVSSAPGSQDESESVADGDGGAIVAWTDTRSSGAPNFFSDIYAQRVPLDAPVPTLVLRAAASVSAGSVHAEWRLSEATSASRSSEPRWSSRGWRLNPVNEGNARLALTT